MKIRGDGELISGVLVASPSGSLAIDTDGDNVLESASPFNFVFSATPKEFYIRNDSTFVTLEASVAISAEFETAGSRDIEFFFDPSTAIGLVRGQTLYVSEPNVGAYTLLAFVSVFHNLVRRKSTRYRSVPNSVLGAYAYELRRREFASQTDVKKSAVAQNEADST